MIRYMSERNLVISFAVLGVLLQLFILFFIIDSNEIFWPDSQKNYAIAKSLSNGVPYSTPVNEANLGRAPGYPFFLSGVMSVVGTDVVSLRLFKISLFPFFIFIVYLIGRHFSNVDSKAAVIAAGLTAIYPYYLYVPLTFYPESILIFLFAAIALSLIYTKKSQNSIFNVLLTSVLIACAVMIRPTAIVWLPVAIFYLSWKHKISFFKHFRTAAIIVLIPALAVISWMSRNHDVHGAFMFTTKPTELLLNTYSENSRWDVKHPPMSERIVKKLRETKDLKEKQRFAVQEAKEFITNNPGRASTIAIMQMLDLWNPVPRTIIEDEYGSKKYKIIPVIMYTFILLLSIPAILMFRKNRFVQALLLLMLFNTLLNGIFMISVRYRIITDFGLILLSSLTLMWLIDRYSIRERLSSRITDLKKL
jgi:4-amino-4-deoxy-L-arabinose transferase-like glycosyltransferase